MPPGFRLIKLFAVKSQEHASQRQNPGCRNTWLSPLPSAPSVLLGLPAGSAMQDRMGRYHIVFQGYLESYRRFLAWIFGDVPYVANVLGICHQDEAVPASRDGRSVGGVWQGDDGFAGGKSHPSASKPGQLWMIVSSNQVFMICRAQLK